MTVAHRKVKFPFPRIPAILPFKCPFVVSHAQQNKAQGISSKTHYTTNLNGLGNSVMDTLLGIDLHVTKVKVLTGDKLVKLDVSAGELVDKLSRGLRKDLRHHKRDHRIPHPCRDRSAL